MNPAMKKRMSREEILAAMLKDPAVRRSVVRRSHYWFFLYYFSHYIHYEFAPFQREIFALTEDASVQNAVITGFRDSAKSTIISLSFPIWVILGKPRLKNVVIVSSTEKKAQILLRHIKDALENNVRLKTDLGPFREERIGWNVDALYIKNYNARISVGSIEQSMRGFRHNEYRPQLLVLDDIEDAESVRTQEGRDKIFDNIIGDILPAGDKNAKLFVVGSVLHSDSPVMRLRKNIEAGLMRGVYRRYPIVDADGNPLWPGKFPDLAAVEAEKTRGFTEAMWRREYLLEDVPIGLQIIDPGWIHQYATLPTDDFRFCATAIDPALKLGDDADYTAMVSFAVYGYGRDRRAYVLPHPINERLNPDQIVARAKAISLALGRGRPTKVYVEDVGFQSVITGLLIKEGIPAESISIHGRDKETRLLSCSAYFQLQRLLFPEQGADRLIAQILNFGTGDHDDLLDALTLALPKILDEQKDSTGMYEYMRQEAERMAAAGGAPTSMRDWQRWAERSQGFMGLS